MGCRNMQTAAGMLIQSTQLGGTRRRHVAVLFVNLLQGSQQSAAASSGTATDTNAAAEEDCCTCS
jgi:hypothetical protein